MMNPNQNFHSLSDLVYISSLSTRELDELFGKKPSKADTLLAFLEILETISESSPFDPKLYERVCGAILDFSVSLISKAFSLFEDFQLKHRIESLSLTSHTPFCNPENFVAKTWDLVLSITERVSKLFKGKLKNFMWDLINKKLDQILAMLSNEYWDLRIRSKISLSSFLQGNEFIEKRNNDLDQKLFEAFQLKLQEELSFHDKKNPFESCKSFQSLNRNNKIFNYQRRLLEELLDRLSDPNLRRKFIHSLKVHRLDKRHFKLRHTIILGDDGGLFSLLNSISDEEKDILIDSNDEFPKDYIKTTAVKGFYKITIGQGGFGKIRLALALSMNDSCHTGDLAMWPGQLICIKKTKGNTGLLEMRNQVLMDYSSLIPVKFVDSPAIYDMTLIESLSNTDHIKGYVMQRFLPVYNGKQSFQKGGKYYNQWSHQNAYLLNLFSGFSELLKMGIGPTDIKPSNTLYDGESKKAKLIDLGSTIRKKSKKELKIVPFHNILQMSKPYMPPEIKAEAPIIDVPKMISYSLGIIIKKIVLDIKDPECPYVNELSDLVNKLTEQDPKSRMSVSKALDKLKELSKTQLKKMDVCPLINSLYAIAKETPGKLGLSKSTSRLKELFIPLEALDSDPSLNLNNGQNQISQDLDQVFENFCQRKREREHDKVLILIGPSGCGKTAFLQKKYLELMKSYKKNEPIPIYVNLQKLVFEKNLRARWEILLSLALKPEQKRSFSLDQISDYSFTIMIDGFDENMRVNFVKKFLDELSNKSNNRVIVACKSDMVDSDNKILSLFYPVHCSVEDVVVKYIAPIGRILDIREYARKYFDFEKIDLEERKFQVAFQTIERNRIMEIINTPFLLHLILGLIMQGKEGCLSKYKIIELSLAEEIKKRINHCSQLLIENLKVVVEVETDELLFFKVLNFSRHLALFLFFEEGAIGSNLKNCESFLCKYGYKKDQPFGNQAISSIVKIADLSYKVLGRTKTQIVYLGFKSDSVMFYFIAKSLIENIRESKFPDLLNIRLITEHSILMRMMSDVISDDYDLIEKLKRVVYLSKSLPELERAACNSLSLLVAANVFFVKEDLSKIKVSNAVLRNGIFQNCTFREADLSNCDLTNAKLGNSEFFKTKMKNVNLGIFPEIRINSPVTAIALSPDNRILLSASEEGLIKVWDISSRKLLHAFWDESSLINCLVFLTSKGDLFLSASNDNSIKLYDIKSFQIIKSFKQHKNWVTSLAISPKELTFLSGSWDSSIILWDLSSFLPIDTFTIEGNFCVLCLAFCPTEGAFLSGSSDNLIRLWDSQTKLVLKLFVGHADKVTSLFCANDGERIISAGCDNLIIEWSITSGSLLRKFNAHSGAITSLVPSPDGKKFLSSSFDQSIKMWDINSFLMLASFEGHNGKISSLAISKDSLSMLSGSSDGKIKNWSLQKAPSFRTYEGHTDGVSCVLYSRDGESILSSSWDKKIGLWNSQSGTLKLWFKGHLERVTSLALSSDGLLFASGSWDCTIKVWDLKSCKLLKSYQHNNRICSVSFSPDSQKILAGCWDNSLKIFDLASNEEICCRNIHKRRVTVAIYSHDGLNILTGSLDKSVGLWAVSEKGVRKLKDFCGHQGRIISLAFKADDSLIISGSVDCTIKIWDREQKALLKTLVGHFGTVTSVAFLKDESKLLSSSLDGTMAIWDWQAGEMLKVFEGHNDCVSSAAISPNGSEVVSSSWDKTIKIWDLMPIERVKGEKSKGNFKLNISREQTHFFCKGMTLIEPEELSEENRTVLLENGAEDEFEYQDEEKKPWCKVF